MDDSVSLPPPAAVTRRRLLQALTAVGVASPWAPRLAAQSHARVSAGALEQASAAILGQELGPERLAIVEKALQRNLDQFQAVRDLVIDDRVEPAPVFLARTHAGPVTGSNRSK